MKNRNAPHGRGIARALLLLGVAASWGCFKPDARPPEPSTDTKLAQHATAGGEITLFDADGNPLTATSTRPYSPSRTCGGCHDFETITQGYHFQQGRGTSNANILVSDNYNPTKTWLLSDGMYGKW